jgi:hypothetical protein
MGRHSTFWRAFVAVVAASLAAVASAAAQDPAASAPAAAPASAAAPSDLDVLVARALEHRNATWRVLHDYVLDERERFALNGPSDMRIFGGDRAYTWYVRDGFLVRSPVKVNGVSVPEDERREYEAKWLKEEEEREKRANEKKAKGGDTSEADPLPTPVSPDGPSAASLGARSIEPRFVSEAYFLRFNFEQGRYFLAGRERIDGRDVVKVEYYPTDLFAADKEDVREKDAEKANPEKRDAGKDARIDRQFNKVILVTIWIDLADAQIVRYDFENLGLDFLPAQWLVRVGDTTASMTMGRYFDGVWLPKSIAFRGDVQFALGDFEAEYTRDFLEYRKADTAARIRSYGSVR